MYETKLLKIWQFANILPICFLPIYIVIYISLKPQPVDPAWVPLIDIGGYEIPAERFDALNHITEDFLKLIFILLCRTQCCINESCEHIIV